MSDTKIHNQVIMKRKALVGLVSVLTIFCVAMFLRNAPHIWDIQMWDETFYMASGIFNWNHGFLNYEGSPLYSYIYRIASAIDPDPMTLHIWMGVAVVAAGIIATSLAVFVISRNVALSAITTAILISSGYSQALPKLVYAAIALMSIGFAISTRLPRFHSKMACVALTAFIVTFIRPEFVIAFYAATAIAIVALAFSYRQFVTARPWPWVTVGILVIVAVLVKLWTFPVLRGGARALQAFGQHFSLYLRDTGKINIDPFFNYEKLLAQYLPGATSEMNALRLYPARVLGYFVYNIESGVKAGLGALAGIATNHPVIAIAVVALAAWCLTKRTRRPLDLASVVAWIVIAVPTAMSIVLIFARDHYLVVAATLMMLLIALVFRWLGARDTAIGAAILLVLTAAVVKPLPAGEQPHLDTATALRMQKPFGALLEMDGGWCYYAAKNCHSLYALDAQAQNMIQYLDQAHINGVMVSAPLLEWSKETGHTEFTEFLQNGAPGWTKIPLSRYYTLLRRTSLDMTDWGNVQTSSIMNYVHVDHLGRQTGTVSKMTDEVLFVHPGVGDPTALSIDLGRLADDATCSGVNVVATLDKGVLPDAIQRGGGVIGITTINSQGQTQKGVVSRGHDVDFSVAVGSPPVKVLVDDHGNPDSDWLNLNIEPTGCGK
ncbi:hypothetical protein EHZ19_27690 [Paraburkholderia bannensis]|uniref:Uncharacterized protein n=1 Tax=Paraburkholderia tropica TaxID=92647 RepID=A0AAQ1JV98_9BURK|nr:MULTISPECIES: hypothetical protein [Paraburkholderia]QNB10664.1 hypothetical protein G5S35_03135 [Paraburkholderia tropica]RQM44660.1 hypothetical protein EHZ19_27690 [Paraburkholderia bannensis]RQN34459.1 hypothetical protein EHZ25_34615 [Paraburkholderia tropica]SEJ93378.1 hypothetical protein SAMN05216550_1118 [Paraburkholderia tropica]